jgi:hypothetical protein
MPKDKVFTIEEIRNWLSEETGMYVTDLNNKKN